jgi:hypothetical protein
MIVGYRRATRAPEDPASKTSSSFVADSLRSGTKNPWTTARDERAGLCSILWIEVDDRRSAELEPPIFVIENGRERAEWESVSGAKAGAATVGLCGCHRGSLLPVTSDELGEHLAEAVDLFDAI